MAYAASMLLISQGALETSVSTWRLFFSWYIDILYTCSEITIYYHIWNYFLTKSLSTNITRLFACTGSNNKDQVYYLLKKWNDTPSPHKACCVVLFPIVLYFWKSNQFSTIFVLFWQLLMLRHATSQATSCRCATCHLLTINFAKFCQYAVAFSNLKIILRVRHNPARSGMVRHGPAKKDPHRDLPEASRRV